MKRVQHFLALSGLVLASAVLCTPAAVEAQGRECSPPHRMRILDLDMTPDPVRQGRPVETWKVTIQSDRNGECQTTIEVRDRDQLAGAGRAVRIRPGRAVYTLPAAPGYRLQGQDHCLIVQANVGGVFTPIDAQRVFCAKMRQITAWSLKEPGDTR